MSRAYQCDRCGMLYAKENRLVDGMELVTHGGIAWDLCDECAKELNIWIKNEEEGET